VRRNAFTFTAENDAATSCEIGLRKGPFVSVRVRGNAVNSPRPKFLQTIYQGQLRDVRFLGELVALAALGRVESNANGPFRGPHQVSSAIESGARRPPSPHERLDEAARLMEQGQFEGALTALQALGQEDPEDLAALLMLGNLYLLYGRANESREAFDRAISRQPLCVEARIFRGVAALQAGLLEEAHSELKKALFLEPTLALGHYLLAHLQERMGALDAAKRSYRNAIKQLRFPQRELAGHYPDLPKTSEAIARVVQYRLAALEDQS